LILLVKDKEESNFIYSNDKKLQLCKNFILILYMELLIHLKFSKIKIIKKIKKIMILLLFIKKIYLYYFNLKYYGLKYCF
jgi:hypothetical protein